jgi:hypothetical protein
MRFLLAILTTALFSTASLAQEEISTEDVATTGSISRADDSCTASTQLDLQRFKDFAGKLSPPEPADSAPIRPSVP